MIFPYFESKRWKSSVNKHETDFLIQMFGENVKDILAKHDY